MAAPGRNQPCPCGSGKRYKECHGAIGAESALDPAVAARADRSWVTPAMFAALRAQKSGRGEEAADTYRRVLAVEPDNFDAMHLLGLAEYEHGRHESAIALLRRAIELKPAIGAARHNLRLVESMPVIEREICREVLPRIVSRVDPVSDFGRWTDSGGPVHIVIADELDEHLEPALEALVRAVELSRLALWTEPSLSCLLPGARSIDAGAGLHPEGGSVVLFGMARSPVAWLANARADKVLLVILKEDPCAVIDRIDQISMLCNARPGLLCASHSLAERLRLPPDAVVVRHESIAVELR
jgi:tetratricopeptide (TPR) repeat protein